MSPRFSTSTLRMRTSGPLSLRVTGVSTTSPVARSVVASMETTQPEDAVPRVTLEPSLPTNQLR